MRGSLERGECRNLEVKIEQLDIYKWFVLIIGEILWFKLLKAFFSGSEVSDSFSFGFKCLLLS